MENTFGKLKKEYFLWLNLTGKNLFDFSDLGVARSSSASKKEDDCLWLFNESLRLVNCNVDHLVN